MSFMKIKYEEAGALAQLGKALATKCEDQSSDPQHPCKYQAGMVGHLALGRQKQAISRASWLAESVSSIFK